MIAVMGSTAEPMIDRVYTELQKRNARVTLLDTDQMPGSLTLALRLPELSGSFVWSDGRRLDLRTLRSVYQRVGFRPFQGTARVAELCLAALNPLLNELPCLVVNRPRAAHSNASKPFQAQLIAGQGWRVPDTLLTSDPELAAEFYELHRGRVIYKSVSYLRSQVQAMSPHDLRRLETVRNCPVQLQEQIQGTDVRVHVVGERVFASQIATRSSDYRFDKGTSVTAVELPPELALDCLQLSQALGLTMAGIDLRITPDGEPVCFEVNPSPAYTYYEDRTGQPITAALCDLLEWAGSRRMAA